MNKLLVPFEFNRDDFNKRVKIELYEGMEAEIEHLLEVCVPLISPKVIFSCNRVETLNSSSIKVESEIFTDQQLIKSLKGVDTIFPFVATCGVELDDIDEFNNDMLASFWLDSLKQMAMNSAFDFFREYIKTNYNIDKLYSINPGSDSCGEGWDINDQAKLFNLFPNITRDIGVTLTESMLMYPNKSVSGFIFQSEKDFVSCMECENEYCPNRKMIHEGKIHH